MIKCPRCAESITTAQVDGIIIRGIASATFNDNGEVTLGVIRPVFSVKQGQEHYGQKFHITCPQCNYRGIAKEFPVSRKSALSNREGTRLFDFDSSFSIYISEDEVDFANMIKENMIPVQLMSDNARFETIATDYTTSVPRTSRSTSIRTPREG